MGTSHCVPVSLCPKQEPTNLESVFVILEFDISLGLGLGLGLGLVCKVVEADWG